MLALHGAFLDGDLCVWLEPESGKNALIQALGELGLVLKSKRVGHSAMAWLPTSGGRPVPSSALMGDAAPGECRIAPHKVTVLPLSPHATVDLLSASADRKLAAPGLLIGEDLKYWIAALRFAAELVTRGQFLPSVSREEGELRARWLAVHDTGRLHALTLAMPAAARALTDLQIEAAPETPAESVLAAFVESMVDTLVRDAAAVERPQAAESLHDRWLTGLRAAPAMEASDAESTQFGQQVNEWQRPIRVATRVPFRLCFRLAEPNPEDAPWKVEYLLQSRKDPSLHLAAAEVWKAKSTAIAELRHDVADLREHLLVSLGQAAGISSQVDASLKQKAPGGYELDSASAHQFLREVAPALEQSGFGVMLPSWWTRRGTTLRLKARARVKSPKSAGGGLTLEAMLNFDWELALGDEPITRAELMALAKQKSPLVKFRGQWVEAGKAEIAAALEFLKKNAGGKKSLRDVIRMALGADGEEGVLEVEGISATGWVGDVLAKLEGREPFAELPQPAGLQGELRPYQRRGFSWLDFLKRLGLGACLADDMGLGKTIQTLALLQQDRTAGERRPVLLVCPMSVMGNWQKEAAKFTPELPVLVHHGTTRKRGETFRSEAERHGMVISSYALLHRDAEILQQVDWAGVVLDEAQNIKNPETKQAKAARALRSDFRISLTGTPVENNVGDLWSVMEFLNPGFLGSRSAFHKKFFVPIQIYSNRYASDRLRRITGPFVLRRLKSDKSIIADLPEKNEMKVFCNLTKEQASLYQSVVKDAEEVIASATGIERKGLVLATLMKLKQVCNHPAQFLKDNSAIAGRSGKLARLGEMLEETLAVGDRSLVFTQFSEMGEMLRKYLQETYGVEVMFLHGGTVKKQRDRMVERFADPDGPRIFLLSLKAGGTGLNLTTASHVFHFDRWWNPAVENQATDRAYRIGQKRNVQVHKFVCAGTLEEKIDEMIERKKEVAGAVVGTGEAWLSEMSNEQLRELFALRKDAVGE
ncbi:MAG TPA: DEAD/DEAH box helicase [Bryobacteraceae bacterium]|nr:DEAD/DEAH box helicase [Bryobacteraceae bacterium]